MILLCVLSVHGIHLLRSCAPGFTYLLRRPDSFESIQGAADTVTCHVLLDTVTCHFFRAWDMTIASEAVHVVCTVALVNAVSRHGHVVEVLKDEGTVIAAFSSPCVGLEWMLTTQLELKCYNWCVCHACYACNAPVSCC